MLLLLFFIAWLATTVSSSSSSASSPNDNRLKFLEQIKRTPLKPVWQPQGHAWPNIWLWHGTSFWSLILIIIQLFISFFGRGGGGVNWPPDYQLINLKAKNQYCGQDCPGLALVLISNHVQSLWKLSILYLVLIFDLWSRRKYCQISKLAQPVNQSVPWQHFHCFT